MCYLGVSCLHHYLIVSTVYQFEKELLNLNGACDLQNVFTRQVNLIMITDITSSVLNLPGLPFPFPFFSACGSATEGMSEIVDFFLQPYMPTIPSSIQDTDDFIRRIRNITDLPSDVLLVTLDVVSLCNCIPHDFGLCSHKDFLLDRNLPDIVVNGIHNMTELVLKKNVFEFNSECFLQTSGTAIGTIMAPAYANIVMSIFEHRLLTGSWNKPFVWLRYIDDIFAIWIYGEDKFKDFMLYINSINSSFQLSCIYSKECVQFLDVSVSVDNSGSISTDLYVKPTDTHQYLMATSCHPNHNKGSVPYCQALRILRICSSKESAKLRSTELVDCLAKEVIINEGLINR